MRMETLWQGQRRAARQRWWQETIEVTDRPGLSWNEVLDETVRLRFQMLPGHGGAQEGTTSFATGRCL